MPESKHQTTDVRRLSKRGRRRDVAAADLSHASGSFAQTNAPPIHDPGARGEAAATVPAVKKKRGRTSLVDDLGPRIFADLIRDAAAGSLLPHEGGLADRYAVSRATVRTVMRNLQEAGYVSIRQGVGTTVLPRSRALDAGMDALLSFETLAKLHNTEIATGDLTIRPTPVPDAIAAVLGIAPGSDATWVQRAKLIDGGPVAWMVDLVPVEILPTATVEARFKGSVLDVLMSDGPHQVGYADCDVLPIALPSDIAAHLLAPPGTVALSMEEVTYTPEGKALAWGRSWMLPSKLRFALRRRRRFV